MLKFILCCLLSLISTISFAQKTTQYSLEYLEKAKCKDCMLMIDSGNGKISQVRTRQVTNKSRSWHGYEVTYYDNESPEEVVQLYKSILHGEYVIFYENGNIQEKGTYRKSLKHGKWTFYDSTGRIEKSIKYKNGNDVSDPVKYYYYFTYGMPGFRDDSYINCRDSIHRKWHFGYNAIAGCVVGRYAQELAIKHNRKVDVKMRSLHGPDWELKMEAEIKALCSDN